MPRPSLVVEVADDLLARIVSGTYRPGQALPSEAELAEEFDVSRLTVREALRSLSTQGVIHVASGVRTSVLPVQDWTSLDAILQHRSANGEDDDVAVQLLEVRSMFEVEAAARAAGNLSAEDFTHLERLLSTMQQASDSDDVAAFVDADLAFHDLVLRRSGNVFLETLFAPLDRVLSDRRTQTSRVPQIQAHAVAEHAAVLDALKTCDPVRAREAMAHHMQQTLDDLRTYVLDSTPVI